MRQGLTIGLRTEGACSQSRCSTRLSYAPTTWDFSGLVFPDACSLRLHRRSSTRSPSPFCSAWVAKSTHGLRGQRPSAEPYGGGRVHHATRVAKSDLRLRAGVH